MAKTLVIDTSEGTRIPFLRGILTRSLYEAGIEFDEAYEIAVVIRQEITSLSEISSQQLRDKVVALLRQRSLQEYIPAYQSTGRIPQTIMVQDAANQATPFSRSQHQLCLESCGLSPKSAEMATRSIYQCLLGDGIRETSSARLGHITYDYLKENFGSEVARHYLVWVEFTHSGRPLILLIGGAPGCGKSTISTEVAHRLGIVRTQSTDMLREVMRMMIPKKLLPILYTSSFNAWKLLPLEQKSDLDQESRITAGYRSQMELISVPSEGVIQRAIRERVSLILEGVHVHPSLIEKISGNGDVIVVPVMLGVLKQDMLLKRLSGRGKRVPGRGSQRYLENFEQIWTLQSFLLSEADHYGVPIVSNDEKEKASIQIMRIIIDVMQGEFSGSPEEVFGYEG
ncbi:MAG: zeta toxin family protein [Candidatus Polarisedimenticolaceae bacterium]|nr:zeta toxin family protein [Candidatus Polarisedimenticolaceae bacterium]